MDRISVLEQTWPTCAGRLKARWHLGKVLSILAVLCLTVVCWTCRRPLFQSNLGVVDPGYVIRSAQPTTQLNRWIRDYKIQSILNLRGGTPADWWYEAEVQSAQAGGVSFYDLPLSAIRRPDRKELLILIDFFQNCRYPLLIHCKWGSDRTGLAAALYLMLRRGETPERAENAFSVEFGHFPIGGPEHLHEPLDEYAAWLKSRGLPHTPKRFRDWVKNDYVADDPPKEPPVLRPGPRNRQPEHAQSDGKS